MIGIIMALCVISITLSVVLWVLNDINTNLGRIADFKKHHDAEIRYNLMRIAQSLEKKQ